MKTELQEILIKIYKVPSWGKPDKLKEKIGNIPMLRFLPVRFILGLAFSNVHQCGWDKSFPGILFNLKLIRICNPNVSGK